MAWKFVTCNRAIMENDVKLLSKFRQFVADTTRGKRRKRILKSDKAIPTCGILNRLIYDPDKDTVDYIVGQYQPAEYEVLRCLFEKGQV